MWTGGSTGASDELPVHRHSIGQLSQAMAPVLGPHCVQKAAAAAATVAAGGESAAAVAAAAAAEVEEEVAAVGESAAAAAVVCKEGGASRQRPLGGEYNAPLME